MLTTLSWVYASLLVLAYCGLSLWCYRATLQRWLTPQTLDGISTLVAYASESGKAQQLAQELSQQLQNQGEAVHCLALNQLDLTQLASLKRLFLLVSTYGEGEPPDNARLFNKRWQQLLKTEPNLAHIQFATLALGDNSYPYFCAYGVNLHEQFQGAHAKPLFAPVLVNRLDSVDLAKWQAQLFNVGVLQNISAPPLFVEAPKHSLVLLKRTLLNPQSPGAPMHQLVFKSQDLTWQAGDIVQLHLHNQMREYSIASIPSEQCLMLLVREQRTAQGALGLGSGFLCQQLSVGESATFSVRSNSAFYSDNMAPAIFIGNGTGLSGLRAHLKKREGHNQQNWLIYGERSSAFDKPCYAELEKWIVNKHLAHLDLTYSRASGEEFASAANAGGAALECGYQQLEGITRHAGYVQHVLRQKASDLQYWVQQGAIIYVCGSLLGMAQDVDRALTEVLGDEIMESLQEQNRYRRDVY